jgi:crotonobetainyl-CoA:carnitine CoA-transferase CaiB-like acyl-CoA transferase
LSDRRGVLAGVRVLDLSRMLSGPYATMMLADHGAEVIKIEDAGGDTSRANGPFRADDPRHEWAGYFVSLNRSKQSIVLDLKSETGKADFRALAAGADVVVENFRPGVMERLGLGYESLAAANPRLVYAAIRGFGDPRTGESPYADWPSYDVVAQAMGGIIALTGPDAATPVKVGPGVGDIFAGALMSFGIIAALRAAEATGRGQFVDVAMYDAMLSLCERAVYQHDFDGTVPGPEGNGHPLLAPFGIFPAADGKVALGIVDDAFWRELARAMADPGLGTDPRFATRAARRANAADVNSRVAAWTSLHGKAALAATLGGRVPFGPVNTVADIFADPHVAGRGMIASIPHPDPGARPWRVAANPVHFASDPAPIPASPPRLGARQAAEFIRVDPPVDTRALRNALGSFATGVTVVTTRDGEGRPRGFTANSFTSVSLDPPLVLVCIAKTAASLESFLAAPFFGISVLGEDQREVSGLFASRDPDKFAKCGWFEGRHGVPLIAGALGHFTCGRERTVDAGDHVIMIGRVQDFGHAEGKPLGYFRGNYFAIGLEDRLVAAAASGGAMRLGAILAGPGGILFIGQPGGGLHLPLAPGPAPRIEGLRADLARAGLAVDVDFLYAVFEDREARQQALYYHGTHAGPLPAGVVAIPLEAIPWDRITSRAERMMLERYAAECRHGNFGIYQGNETEGEVRRIASAP